MASAVTESALLAALSALLYMASWTPLLSSFILLACAVPITIAGVKHGGGRAWLAMLCAAILIGLTGGPTEALIYLCPFGVMGALCGHFLHVDEEPTRHFLLGSGWLFVASVFSALVIERLMGLGKTLEEIQVGFASSFVWAAKYLSWPEPAVLGVFRWTVTAMLCPLWFFAVFSAVLYYSNHLFSFLLLWRLRIPSSPPPDMRTLRTPRLLLPATVALLVVYVWAGPLSCTTTASLAFSALLIALFLAYACGFAVSVTLLDRSTMKPLARMGMSLLIMFVVFPLTALMGLADSAMDLRARTAAKVAKPLRGF